MNNPVVILAVYLLGGIGLFWLLSLFLYLTNRRQRRQGLNKWKR